MSRLGDDLAAAFDPCLLASKIGMNPDPWQADVLRSGAPRLLLLCARQSGKSTIAAIMAVHTAVYEPGALVLLLSPSMRQSQELFRKCIGTYRVLGRPVPSSAENALSLTLENGSRIVSLPGGESTIRGYSGVRLLLVDEAARVIDETYFSARPMLAVSQGRIVLMSTPAGRRGFFFEAAERESGWLKVRVPASDCPRLGAAFLVEERSTLGDYWFRQEYELAFVDDAAALFTEELVSRAFTSEVEPLFNIIKSMEVSA